MVKQIILINASHEFEKVRGYKDVLKSISSLLKSNNIPLTLIHHEYYKKSKSPEEIEEEVETFLKNYHMDNISENYYELFENNISHMIIVHTPFG